MPDSLHHSQSAAGRSPRWIHGLRAAVALSAAGALAAPLVGIAAAQTGSLGSAGSAGSSGPGVTAPPTTTPPTTTPPPPADVTVELRVLVLDDGSPMVHAIAERLVAEGVRVDRRPIGGAGLTREMLADDATRTARYMGVVSPQAARDGLPDAEDAVLNRYLADYGVREVTAYNWRARTSVSMRRSTTVGSTASRWRSTRRPVTGRISTAPSPSTTSIRSKRSPGATSPRRPRAPRSVRCSVPPRPEGHRGSSWASTPRRDANN